MSKRTPKSGAGEVALKGRSRSCLWEGTAPVVSPGRLSPRSQQGWALHRDLCPGKAELQLQGTHCSCRTSAGEPGCAPGSEPGIPPGKRCHSSLCGLCPPLVKASSACMPRGTERMSRAGENAAHGASWADTCLQTCDGPGKTSLMLLIMLMLNVIDNSIGSGRF